MNDQEEVLVWLLRMTGMRVGEALALKWSDIDLFAGNITIESGKFGKSRAIPILPELRPRLQRWAQHLEARDLYDPRGPVLITRNRTPWVPQHAEKLVRRVGERAGLERLTPHKLRRTFGSDLLNRGLRIEAVAALLGHAHVGVTQKSYAQLMDETIRAELLSVVAG
jgi:integrase